MARVVKAAFGQRRKTLNNTLTARAATFGLSPEQLRAILAELAIDPVRRGETLSLAEFVALSNKIAEMRKDNHQERNLGQASTDILVVPTWAGDTPDPT